MIIYYNYTTICRKIQVCIFFFDRKINFLRCHLCNKMSFSWIPEFFRKERTGVFHLSISITEHHFHVELANFSEKKKPDIPLNCDISGFSHSFEVRIFNCQITLILIQCTHNAKTCTHFNYNRFLVASTYDKCFLINQID